MDEQYARPYIDACAWVGWISREVREGIDRWRVLEHILRHARNGLYKISISAAMLAEVHKVNGAATLSDEQSNQILAYFEGEHIQIIDVDRWIGEEAHKLCRQYSLKPFDAIHIASALRAGCDYFLTWDDKVLKCSVSGIIIEQPQMRGQRFLDL